jgi:hypothetical protein
MNALETNSEYADANTRAGIARSVNRIRRAFEGKGKAQVAFVTKVMDSMEAVSDEDVKNHLGKVLDALELAPDREVAMNGEDGSGPAGFFRNAAKLYNSNIKKGASESEAKEK